MQNNNSDCLIIGSGIAGLTAAIKAAQFGIVNVICKDTLMDNNTRYAQGGVAVALSSEDSPDLHYNDTLLAGAGICRKEAVKVLVEEGPRVLQDLISSGMKFDSHEGEIHLTREGAHSRKRVLHAGGDATGEKLMSFLIGEAKRHENIYIWENTFAMDLILKNDHCFGTTAFNCNSKEELLFSAPVTILATGGAGQVFSLTTNPTGSTGDGIAMAYRGGAAVVDMEFYQFHPTVFIGTKSNNPFLISEAVRGEGGRLINSLGNMFMSNYHPMAELGPRDVVARAIVTEKERCGGEVYLSVTHLSGSFIRKRFPTIFNSCLKEGIDIAKEPIPVTPAAHYLMGGIKTNNNGETNIPGLYCCGEAACTGVHGANRLASNSLLEGLVFASRAGENKRKSNDRGFVSDLKYSCHDDINKRKHKKDYTKLKSELQQAMFAQAGINKTEENLSALLSTLERISNIDNEVNAIDRSYWEFTNMLDIAFLITKAALWRKESRGSHYRLDYPQKNSLWEDKHLTFLNLGERKVSIG